MSTKQEPHLRHQNQTEEHSLLMVPCDSLSNPDSQNTGFLKLSTNTNARSLALKCSSTSAGEMKPGVRPERHFLTQLSVCTCSCSALRGGWNFLSFKTTQGTLCSWSCTQILLSCPTQATGNVKKVPMVTDLSGSQHSSNNFPLTLRLAEHRTRLFGTALEHLQSATAELTSKLHEQPWTEKTLALWRREHQRFLEVLFSGY